MSRLPPTCLPSASPIFVRRLDFVYFVNGSRGKEEAPTKIVVGEDIMITVSALDAFDNLCEEQAQSKCVRVSAGKCWHWSGVVCRG